MAVAKPKKFDRSAAEVDLIKSDVVSFASSLGLSSGGVGGGGGFDDSDFRKSGHLNPSISPNPKPNPEKNASLSSTSNLKPGRPHPLQIDPFATSSDKKKNELPKLPLMKANLLSGQWYVDAEELEMRVLGEDGARKAPAATGFEKLKQLAERKKEVAERLLEQYARDYEASRKKSGDMRLLESTARAGTSADKVSAFTCLVEDNPIANMRSLDALLSMVTSKVGKRYAFAGFEALKELFQLRLLPDRKLKSLLQRPLDSLPENKDGFSLLLFWHWEECLKQRYERFIIALEDAIKDMLPNLKEKAMKTVYSLLRSKPEQERRLLSALVNKLGDPERKTASSAGYHLSCLLSAHPNMKAVVIDEVDSFIFRPHVGSRAKYQAVNFLSQVLLSTKGDGPKIAKRLVDVYFALFKVLISYASDGKGAFKRSKNDDKSSENRKEKGKKDKRTNSLLKNKEDPSTESTFEMDSRLLSALLTGVNRAFPFVASDEADDIIEVQTPILFRLVHSENFNVGVQALMLLYQISSKNQIVSDRFYRALYSKLLTPAALYSSKPEMFLGLLVKAMKNDVNLKRVSAFSKRLLQVALQRPPQYACGCLFLLSEVLKGKPPLWTMALQNESADDDLEHFEDIIESPDGALIVPQSDDAENSRGLAALQNGKTALHIKEVYNSEGEGELKDEVILENVNHADRGQAEGPHVRSSLPAGYNPRHREPSYCNADRTSWWELTVLAAHAHPSVATMARTLLSGVNIVYNGDPLNDLSLIAFLDKFMEKKPKPNPKAEGRWHGGSLIAPAKKVDLNHGLIGDEILQLAEEEVPPEDVVFHRFYMNKTNSSKKPKAKKKKASEDDEVAEELLADVSDESEEEEIDKMLGTRKLPHVEETEGGYDYDDLDRVAVEDDDDLIGGGSDTEIGSADLPSDKDDEENLSEDDDNDNHGSLDIWDADVVDGNNDDLEADEQPKPTKKGKKRKLSGKTGASPFASLDEYEHLMRNDEGTGKKSKSRKSKKKKASD